ncbi:hypothetical protein V1264_006415 [Littorina saxatilis]
MNEPFEDDEIQKVHLVFMNHLDVGYDGVGVTGYAVNVINTYFRSYFPRAIAVADELRTLGYEERFIYTTHPWLLDLYTNCPNWILASGSLKCPNSTELASLEKAIRQGDITWHAAPMNMQYEMYFTHLLDVSLNISSRLDQRYDITRTHPVLSLRDVPGLTKAVIPILQKHNIAGVSVGINSAAAFPAVPPYPFLWKLDEEDTTGVVAFWHNKGYPSGPGLTPATPGGLSRHDCHIPQRISQFPEALCFAFRQDNQGPPLNYTEVLNNFEVARGQFLNAKVQASTLDNFVGGLLAAKPTLPVSSQEIGDPWILGVSSDPLKTIRYRAFGRALDACFESGNCSSDDPRIINMVRYLTKIPEHTWGLIRISEKDTNYSNADFRKKRAAGDYSNWETSWKEQRQFLDLSYSALKDHPLADQIQHEWGLTLVKKPNLTDYHEVAPFQTFTCGDGTVLQFDSEGALQKMFEPYNKISWADPTHPIAQIMYTTYNETAYLDSARAEEHHQRHPRSEKLPQSHYPYPTTEWPMKLQHLYSKPLASTCDFWLQLTPQDQEAVTSYGCPELFYVHIAVRPKAQNIDPGLDMEVQWHGKLPTRYTESISMHVKPIMPVAGTWHLSKLGQMIQPEEVVTNGSHYIHAVDRSVCLMTKEMSGLEFLTPDVAHVMLGTDARPGLGPFPQPYGPLKGPVNQMGFNLFNNLWKTNYIFWYPFNDVEDEGSFKARFTLNFVTM